MTEHLRERIAAAIRAAACNGDCGSTEEECVRQRIQPCVWHHGVLAEVLGSPEVFAQVALAALLTGADREPRTRLDDLTSDALDQLYDDLDRYADILGEMNEQAVLAAKQLAAAQQDVKRLGLMVDEYGAGAGALTDKLKRVRDLHQRAYDGSCSHCTGLYAVPYPCPTIQALDQPQPEQPARSRACLIAGRGGFPCLEHAHCHTCDPAATEATDAAEPDVPS